MIRTGFSALLSHWRRRPLQFLTLFLGLALATALWSGVQAINTEARASYTRAASTVSDTTLAQITRKDGAPISQTDYIALRRMGWQVSPMVEGSYNGQQILGIDPLSAPLPATAAMLTGETSLLDFISEPGMAIIHPGDTSPLTRFVTDKNVPKGTAIMDIGVAQTLLGKPDQITRLLVLPNQPRNLPALPAHLSQSQTTDTADMSRLTDSFHLNLTAFGLLSFAVGLFIVQASIGLAFEQRRPMIRTLRALGLPINTLIAMLLAELLLIALAAGLVGIALGYVIASSLLPDVAATLRGLYGADVAGTLQFRASWWATGVAIAVLGTLVAGAAALWQLARMPLLVPAQPRAWARASVRALRWQSLAALVLFGFAVVMNFVGGLVASFALLGAMLIGAALLLPVFLHGFLSFMRARARSALSHWFWADTAQQLPGLSLALMALMLALAANIGVGTMVSSFRETFTGWLDQRLASELYVRARTQDEAQRLQSFLEPRADAVLPIWNSDGFYADQPLEIYGVINHPTYSDNWPMLEQSPDAWNELAQGGGVLINEQLARRENIWSGDAITLPGDWQTQVLGVYSDYGNTTFQVLISHQDLTTRFEVTERLRFGVRTDTPDDLARAITQEFALPADNLIRQNELKTLSLNVFERTFTVTGALNILTFGVAGFALLTSLLTLASMRLPQLAPVWAMGLTRRKLAMLELIHALVLAALTAVFALPVGLGLAYVLLNIVNVSAFGWQLPMFLFPLQWFWLFCLAIVAAILAALWPSWRLSRLPPADLLRVFANER